MKNIEKNDDLGLLGYYLWLDKLTRRSGTILDRSHQDISGRKLRKLGKSQERYESVLHLAHVQPNLEEIYLGDLSQICRKHAVLLSEIGSPKIIIWAIFRMNFFAQINV